LYGQLEEEHGLAKRAMAVYDRATRAVEAKDRMEVRPPPVISPSGPPATRALS